MPANKKLRSCLRCDHKFLTVPELRICSACKAPTLTAHGRTRFGVKYAPFIEACGGLGYNRTFTKPANTRFNGED